MINNPDPTGRRFAFLDAGETARQLQIDRTALDQWVREGRIKAYRGVGKDSFFKSAEVEALYKELHPEAAMAAAVAAGFAKKDTMFGIVTGAHLLEQTIYLVASGLLVFIFGFSAYFRLTPSRPVFGIALGLGISACVHLATWAILANGGLPTAKRGILDFVNMATYHICVLIWSYYLLVPAKTTVNLAVALPENNLDIWNRELERLVHP